MIKLRPMTMDDAVFMLKLKNYHETRKFAIKSKGKILFDDHVKWLKSNLKYFQIIEYGKKIAGAIRVENKEVSVWLDRAMRRKGLATQAVDSVSKHGYSAKIVTGNVPSMRVFITCGYSPVSFTNGYYTFKK